jgi:uncharacterized protein HemX
MKGPIPTYIAHVPVSKGNSGIVVLIIIAIIIIASGIYYLWKQEQEKY